MLEKKSGAKKLNLSRDKINSCSKLFTRKFFLDFVYTEGLNCQEFVTTENIIKDKTDLSLLDIFEEVFEYLKVYRRDDYIYKSLLFETFSENAFFLNEVNLRTSIIDMVKIKDEKIIGYEIKSDVDSLGRLEKQLIDYIKVFEYVYVVIAKKKLHKVEKILEKNVLFNKVGVLLLEGDKYEKHKDAKSNIESLEKESIFKVVYTGELKRYFGGGDYEENKDKFFSLGINEVNQLLRDILVTRIKDHSYIEDLPRSLRMMGYTVNNTLTKRDKREVAKCLKKNLTC